MGGQLMAYLKLVRPANLLTAVADILAGISVAGYWEYLASDTGESGSIVPIILLICSTLGLYGGGVVFNDVFDYELDKQERPERPLPRGQVSLKSAIVLGIFLLVVGFIAAFAVNLYSGLIAVTTGLLAVWYDAISKHSVWAGPLNMGLCRGGNLLLGVSVVPAVLSEVYLIAIIPVMYIGAITLISQGEVHGGNRKSFVLAFVLYVLVLLGILGLGIIKNRPVTQGVPFLLFLLYLVIPHLLRAYQTLKPEHIQKAVKTGVLSLIVLNASIAAITAGWVIGGIVLLLLPFSIILAKRFAVT